MRSSRRNIIFSVITQSFFTRYSIKLCGVKQFLPGPDFIEPSKTSCCVCCSGKDVLNVEQTLSVIKKDFHKMWGIWRESPGSAAFSANQHVLSREGPKLPPPTYWNMPCRNYSRLKMSNNWKNIPWLPRKVIKVKITLQMSIQMSNNWPHCQYRTTWQSV